VQPRRLLLIRHAKAADAAVDRDRPLTARGARNAAAIGTWLARGGYAPDRIVVSPALRAAQTWEQAAAAAAPDLPPTVDDRIYDNTLESVLATITETSDDVRTLVVVGHNPSVGELAFALDDGDGDPAPRRELHAGFPAGAVAVFALTTSFADLGPAGATLADFAVPTA
jgi:phosphohistidine phosphatase